MHHTKMIYKIIEKPVLAETVTTPSSGQVGYREESATAGAPRGTRGDENQTVATTFRYHDRGRQGPAAVEHRGRGLDGDHRPHGRLREGDPSSKWSSAHGTRVEGGRHKHNYGNAAVVDHGPRYHVWHGKQTGGESVKHAIGDHKRGHPVEAVHGHFGGVLRVAGDHEHGGVRFGHLKPAHLEDHWHFADHQHVHFGDHKHGNFGDHKHGNFDGHSGRQNFDHFGGHRLEHFGGSGRGNFGSPWRAQATSDADFRGGQNQRGRPTVLPGSHWHGDVSEFGGTGTGGASDQPGHSAAASPGPDAAHRELGGYEFPKLLHDHLQFSNPVYGHHHGAGGYQVQENVADFNGINSIAVPPPHPAAAAAQSFHAGHNYPSPAPSTGGSNPVDGMQSVFSIPSPPTVNNVYYTLDPVVPYDDTTLRSQRETVQNGL
ncbi:hypothetical protein AGLY_009367 [Aphis glycines]|uniref:Uncharacterized protein n=1 Tax=Aphis glycines TaxID=307491 RepID=A0A6G0TH82_APHGL|nr:hypothetical protein AGLY_009367 [Aphis glycines]